MKCNNCGSELNGSAKFCRNCGAKVVFQTEAAENNKCSACGNVLAPGAVFCNNCGNRAENSPPAQEQGVRCPNCGKDLKANALFCTGCGTSLAPYKAQTENVKAPERKKRDAGMIVLIIILVTAIIACLGVGTFIYFQNQSTESETSKISDTKDKDDEKEPEDDELDEDFFSEEDKKAEDEEEIPVADVEEVPVDETVYEPVNEYLFPSDIQHITDYDLYGKTKEEVALIRNEIYARHGYIFNTEPFKSYFSAKPWYIPNPNFNESVFSEIEKANKDFLVEYENRNGWR